MAGRVALVAELVDMVFKLRDGARPPSLNVTVGSTGPTGLLRRSAVCVSFSSIMVVFLMVSGVIARPDSRISAHTMQRRNKRHR
jgi:hypothetical protein